MDKKMIKPEYSGLEIAVIGMAGRFPGAGNIDDFWENLKNGVESVKFFSDAELVEAGLDRETIDNPNFIKAYGDLDGREYFDSSFFGYVPEEALVMDPQMRLFHECVWEALEDAGYPPDTYDGLIGLYGGAGPGFCWEIYAAAFASHAIDSFSANQLRNRDYLCARISYKLNLKGPAVFVQTACSTGLVAVHLASRGLLTGETHIALAGGVALKINSFPGYIYQEGMIYTRDGHTRAFDAKANGVMGGEGAGVVVLKLLKHAMADQDHIWAIIKGTAINNDGLRKVGFTAPSPDGQAEVIRMALKMSRVDPQTIGYIETHGTATPLGDIIEMEALNLVFGKGKEKRCPIGSVKTNIGHTDAAAGSASLIKTVLALKYRQIPPSLHFQTPNPNIDFSSFYVNTALQDWISDGDHPRRAGVSSFGIGGTNAHVILEEFQGLFLKKPPLDPAKTFDFGLMIFSAKSQAALDRMIGNYYDFFEKNKEIAIEDAAYTLQLGRSSFPHRAFFVCKDADDAREILSAPASGKIKRFSIPKKGKPPVFMFSGQGTYYINMGLELYQSQDPCVAVFRRELDRCFELIKSENDFKAILFPEKGKEEPEALNRTSISQPLLFMFEYALASMLIAWGIKPGAMIGYSTGEYTAACLAGVFSLENALKLVALRGRLVEALPVGAMLSVPLTENELLPILKSHEELSLAVDNGSSCVVSGTPEDISAFEKEMKAQKRLCIRLNVTHAGHSRILEPIVEIYEAAVREVKPQKPSERYVSTVTGQWITDAQATDPGYWAQHIQSPVRFFQGLNVLMGEDYSTFIEIGPGKSLSNFARQHPGKKEGMLIANLVRDMNETVSDMYYLMDRLGRMWLYGQSIDWKKFYGEKKKHRMSLPTYPFEKIRYPSTVNISKIVSDLTAVMGDKFGKNEAYGNAVFSEASYKAERPELVTPYVEPSTLTEKELVLMWENFFGVGKIGIIDDFFELGGDSL
ncbi:MAG: beta-ketoacyl synthase N-terminal-like domain-containing protein, partial [Candidatus Omnitrophota bacterium]